MYSSNQSILILSSRTLSATAIDRKICHLSSKVHILKQQCHRSSTSIPQLPVLQLPDLPIPQSLVIFTLMAEAEEQELADLAAWAEATIVRHLHKQLAGNKSAAEDLRNENI
jgi:hypothetical protein